MKLDTILDLFDEQGIAREEFFSLARRGWVPGRNICGQQWHIEDADFAQLMSRLAARLGKERLLAGLEKDFVRRVAATASAQKAPPVPETPHDPTEPAVSAPGLPQAAWSQYQLDFFAAVLAGKDNIALRAVAGSGKTSTIVEGCKRIDPAKRGLFMAFNKDIAAKLKSLMPENCEAVTFHAAGLRMLRQQLGDKLGLDPKKYQGILETIFPETPGDGWPEKKVVLQKRRMIGEIVEMLQANAVMPDIADFSDHVVKIIYEYGIEIDDLEGSLSLPQIVSHCRATICAGIEIAHTLLKISFSDMVYLPIFLKCVNAQPPDFIFVDECQDQSAAQRELLKLIAGPAVATRIYAVGDPRQAIYGFAGAAINSFDLVALAFNMKTMPLSVNNRCGKVILARARAYCPEIQAAEAAIEGSVEALSFPPNGLDLSIFHERDFVLCRKTAPLIRLFFVLANAQKSCTLKGKDMGKQLCALVEKIGKRRGFRYEKFQDAAKKFFAKKIAAAKTPDKVAMLEDMAEPITNLFEGLAAPDMAEFLERIKAMFSDSAEGDSITLSTIHRAKGLEADRVIFYGFQFCPLRWRGQLDWEREQELNLIYVAMTRAKKELVLVKHDFRLAASRET